MAESKIILLVATGDLRLSANEICWPAQHVMERAFAATTARFGYKLVRAHPYKPAQKHGFISSQKEGMAVFARLDPQTPIFAAGNPLWASSTRAGQVQRRHPRRAAVPDRRRPGKAFPVGALLRRDAGW